MNLASLDFALSHISSSVRNLTKKNFKQTASDLSHLTTLHGQEAERHLFRCLFSAIDFTGDGKSNNGKDTFQIQLLQQECAALIAKPNCISILCFALESPFQRQKTLKPSSQLLSQISKILKLNKLQEVVFGVVLLNSSNPDIKYHAKVFTRLKFPDLISSFLDTESGGRESGLHEAAVEVLHRLLVDLVDSENPSGTSTELKEQFLAALRRDFPRERTPVILAPLLYSEQFNYTLEQLNPSSVALPNKVMEARLAECLKEIGYSCTSEKDKCRQTLTQLGGVREVTAKAVAQVLGMMSKTVTGLQDGLHMQTLNMPNSLWVTESRPEGQPTQQTWNVDVFVQVVQEMSPSLNWRDVVREFDHDGFMVVSRQGLQLIMMAVCKAMHNAFPIDELFKPWTNSEGQMSWFAVALNNPDVFCFGNFLKQKLKLDNLKAPPDAESIDVLTWQSSELVESLIRLSDLGHYQKVMDLIKSAAGSCPDVIMINILNTTSPWNTTKKDMVLTILPAFLINHPNSGMMLQMMWNFQSHTHGPMLRTLMMYGMADWFLKGGEENDQTRLSRILDVAQDLKALSMLLNISQFSFVVELACLASRREYLKLDKWLSDKIRDHGEVFIEALIGFLRRRCPLLVGYKDEMAHQRQSSKVQLSIDAVNTILSVLQTFAGGIRSEELTKEVAQLVGNAGSYIKTRAMQQPIMSSMPPMMNMPSGSNGPPPVSVIENSFVNLSLQAPTPGGSPAKFNQTNNVTAGAPGLPGSNTSLTNLQPMRIVQPDHMMMSGNRGQPQAFNNRSIQPNAALAPSQPVIDSPTTFSSDVEDEANSYFQKIYNQPPNNFGIDDVLKMLKQFKDSNIKHERDVFCCMLRNLFEENTFFPQYPERELHVTALLLGGIVDHGLIQHMALGTALKYVLEGLKAEPGSKMFMFGTSALDKFKTRLKDCAQYCQHIVALPHFNQFPSILAEYVSYGKLGQEPPLNSTGSMSHHANAVAALPVSSTLPQQPAIAPSMNTASTVPQATFPGSPAPPATNSANSQKGAGVIGLPNKQVSKPSLAHTTNIDTLLAGNDEKMDLSIPPETTQDKVFFIFNNLSQMNIQQKADELLQALKDDHIPWAAQYLVMKRASIEPNFHPLYSSFLDTLSKTTLNSRVLVETFRNIKVLLRSDKGVSNFSDRSLLKNLGHWLGLITLAKNKPILHLDLDLKGLLYEANSKGSEELLYVVPFVAKVLESCEKSRIFRPPNPWTLGILNVLAELHQQHQLKLNLKFEIEVLCKHLHLDLQELNATHFLMDDTYMEILECQLTVRPKQQESQMMINMPVPRAGSVGVPDMEQAPTPNQSTLAQQVPASRPTPQPQYSYSDINVSSMANLAPHIHISDQLPLFQLNKALKALVRPVLERSISDLILPVVERSIKIALTTCESVVKKDFALDPEEQRMMGAAHSIIRSLTAGMALITCRDPLLISIQTGLKQAFIGSFNRSALTLQHKEMIEKAAQVIAQDNTELACVFIQKTAVEKAIPEIDKRLAGEFELRLTARQEGRRYCDPVAQKYQMEVIPEPIRLKPGNAAPSQQMSVYHEFARNIPGFAIAGGSSNMSSDLLGQQNMINSKQHTNFLADEIGAMYEKVGNDIEGQLQVLSSSQAASTNSAQLSALQMLASMLKKAAQSRDIVMTAITLIQKTVESFLECYNSNAITEISLASRVRDCHLVVLRGLYGPRAFGSNWTKDHVTRSMVESKDDIRYNDEAVECLIKAGLVHLTQYDNSLAAFMENGTNYNGVKLAMRLIQRLIVKEKGSELITESDFSNTVVSLIKIPSAQYRLLPDGLAEMVDYLRQQNDGGLVPGSPSGPTSMMQSGINQAKDTNDPPGLHEKTEYLLREWVQLYHNPGIARDYNRQAFTQFVNQMSQQGILKSDELITRFFRLCTQLCVDVTYSTLKNFSTNAALVRAQCFKTLDAYVRLIVLLVKLSGEANNPATKINLLNKVLGIVAGVLMSDHDSKGKEFQQLPFHRIFIMLFIELNAPEHILEAMNFQVLTAFVNTYRILRPARYPGFAFAWLELISHRAFIGRMLQLTAQQRGWNMYAQILIDLFKFLAPFLRNADLNRAMQVLYKGTLRVLLVLLHDFPEFLCDYHYAFCDVIPPNCIQMRNLILSAFPRNMRLPDPFTPNLKVDMLTEIAHAPKIMTNVAAMIQPESFRKDLESYLKSRSPSTFLSELRSKLQITNDPGNRYNIPLMNALVLHVGTQAIQNLQLKGMSPNTSTITQTSHMEIFQNLSLDLDTEGRYLFLNAIANQLRFPNSHTHYFSCALLSLFADAHSVALQEQITRVLLERLIVNRPHPWGLLVTFIELIRNQVYKFWGHDFVHCSPEIARLFETVAKSCNQNRSQARGSQ